ncbi:MAG: ROK family protein [Candidatus Omnitrophica bacterium]|nr:ROK family protein [Candidatus Omnitrophota bacterium]
MHPIDFQDETFSEKERRNIDILELLRKRGPLSKPEISKEIGINVVTISNYIEDFIRHSIVFEKELDVSEGGRRPVLLDLNPQGGYIIGVGLNLMNMVGVLIDLKGNILTKTQIAKPPTSSVKDVTECLLQIIREIFRRSKEYVSNIKGIGVGIAGLVSKQNGSIHWPQKVDSYYTYASVDLPLKNLIEREFNVPALIENDATAACFGEYWLGMERGIRNMIYLFSGVGCGLILNGQVYRGAQGYAGEVSIYNFKQDDLFNCQAGKPCFLKRWEMDLGIVEDVKERFAQDKQAATQFCKLTGATMENIDLKSILIAARTGEPNIWAALDAAAQRLGIRAAALVNLLNPDMVVVGGGLEEAGERFLHQVNQTIKEWAFREDTEELKVVYSQLRENAVALGAASLVMQRLFAQLW